MQFDVDIKDRYVINKSVFYLLGMVVAVPFHFYINSLDYWMHKLQPHSRKHGYGTGPGPPTNHPNLGVTRKYFLFSEENEVWNSNAIAGSTPYHQWLTPSFSNSSTPPDERTPIQANFTTAFNITNQVALLGALLICSFLSKKLPPAEKRLKWSLIALCIIFSLNTLATPIHSGHMVNWFFGGTIILATVMNFCVGMAKASLYELMSKFPPSFYVSISSGQNISGVISSILQVCLRAALLHPKINAAIYFSCGTIILTFTTIYYCYIKNNSKYFIYKIGQGGKQRFSRSGTVVKSTPIAKLLWKIKWYFATIIFVVGTTSMLYPGLTVLVLPITWEKGNAWKEIYFVPVITFMGFQVSNLIGREAVRIIKIPKNGTFLFILALLRISIIPLMIFCNSQPRRHLPVFFYDNEFIILVFTLGFSDGLLLTMAIVAIPMVLEKEERKAVMVLIPLIFSVTMTLASGLNVFITNVI